MWRNTGDVLAHGFHHRFEVAWFVGAKPISVVIVFQVVKKTEKVLVEAFEFNRGGYSGSGSRNAGSASNTDKRARSCNKAEFVVWATDS